MFHAPTAHSLGRPAPKGIQKAIPFLLCKRIGTSKIMEEFKSIGNQKQCSSKLLYQLPAFC
jgi:hypothetical protein